MRKKHGFTLVELLVVIAIITILAATVVPKVTNWITSGRVARANSEIKSMDLALTKMLTDADRSSFAQFFDPAKGVSLAVAAESAINQEDGIIAAAKVYSDVFYELLRLGKNADLSDYKLYIQDSVRKKLGNSYMDIGKDPWGQYNYFFWAGPYQKIRKVDPNNGQALDQFGNAMQIYFRCYRENVDPTVPYIYDDVAKGNADEEMRGNPAWDGAPGYPAPLDLPVYIWSVGENMVSDQLITTPDAASDYIGGGDDINNWDNAQGWNTIY